MPAGYTLKVVSKKTKVWNLFKGDYKDAKKIDLWLLFYTVTNGANMKMKIYVKNDGR